MLLKIILAPINLEIAHHQNASFFLFKQLGPILY